MSGFKVAICRCRSYEQREVSSALARQFELLGGLDRFISPGDTVMIKPNLIAPKPADSAAITHPVAIVETAKLIKDFGAKPIVADSPAWSDVFECMKVLGIDDELRRVGAEVKQLNRPVRCKLQRSGVNIGISKAAIEADRIINLPKLKAHQQLGATIAVKNMFGCVSGKSKALWHFRKGGDVGEFCLMLIDIYSKLAPAITIVDAVDAMEGAGPIRGQRRTIGCLVGGEDAIAVEMVCSGIINMPTERLPIVETAMDIGFGCSGREEIETVGDSAADFICSDFKLAEIIPLRFSLPRIVKSVSRQIGLKFRAFAGGK